LEIALQAFSLPQRASQLRGQYVDSTALSIAMRNMGEIHMKQVLRLWFLGGIPYAFDASPMIYEALRDWLAPRLRVSPLDIALIGSARIGYSPRPFPKYGTPFGPASDLDFAVISKFLFDLVHRDFIKWQDECDEGKAKPIDENQRSSLKQLPRNIQWGFIDTNRIPTRYENVRAVMWSMDLLLKKLNQTPDAPKVRYASVRVYDNWDSFQRRILFNLKSTKDSLLPQR